MDINLNGGNILLAISCASSVAALVPAAIHAAGYVRADAYARAFYYASGIAVLFASILLFYYFISGDFRFAYVYNNSSLSLSIPYRVAAFWAGKEGSFLLWLLILYFMGLVIALSQKPLAAEAFAILIAVQLFFLVILLAESPFKFIWNAYPDMFRPGSFPRDGAGLNPLLRDPWMVAHPPFLFLGYAAATVPFGYAVAGCVRGERDSWVTASYPWLIFSASTLGIGIFLGGYWAYSVLGWGGYWGWDPVENSSLVPWLLSIALIHGFIIQRRTGALPRANALLAIAYFLAVLYSTWLTRSGALSNISVHSFSASSIGSYLSALLVIFSFLGIGVFVWRARLLVGTPLSGSFRDWKTLIVYGIISLCLYAACIGAATSLPVVTSIITGRPVTVTEAFYHSISMPFGVAIVAIMFTATAMIAGGGSFLKRATIAAAVLSLAGGIGINIGHTSHPFAYLFAACALFAILRAIAEIAANPRLRLLPSRISHIGVGILVLGLVTSNAHSVTIQKELPKDIPTKIGDVTVAFLGVKETRESALIFSVNTGGVARTVETAYYYDDRTESLYREPYILSGFEYDYYLSPEIYHNGMERATRLELAKDETAEFDDARIQFIGFRTEHMTSHQPTTYADCTVNGILVSPGIRFVNGSPVRITQPMPGTDRVISLLQIDATSKRILLHISPGARTVIPPDSAVVSVTWKRFIWLVWLGTVLIAAGGIVTMAFAVQRAAIQNK